MQQPRTRRVERIHLAHPLQARLGTAAVVLVDLSVLGARVEHHAPLGSPAGNSSRLTFEWEGEPLQLDCRIVRSRIERFSVGTDGLTVYHSGLEFVRVPADTGTRLRTLISIFVAQALEEQKLNARGVMPQHEAGKMPIFRHDGQLTANAKEVKDAAGQAMLPAVRVAKDSGYVCYQLDRQNWRKKRTHDPGQPAEGFTISALEDQEQAELLCAAYRSCDAQGRRMIQLFAQLSIMEGEGTSPRRFDP